MQSIRLATCLTTTATCITTTAAYIICSDSYIIPGPVEDIPTADQMSHTGSVVMQPKPEMMHVAG